MSRMSAAQTSAFESGTGGMFSAAQMSSSVAVLICASMFAWALWIVISVYRQWVNGEVKAAEAFSRTIRAMVVMTVVFVVVLV